MSPLKGKRIILGITGSIAAYKAAFLVRLLIKNECEVKVIMTTSATTFISSLTLATLSKNDVLSEISSDEIWNNHVELGLWADAMVIAPCTANTLGKLSNGLADNMLVATYLSAKCPVFIAPAMDLDMWIHGSTKVNLECLKSFGNILIDVGNGELASGLVGDGRMAEPEDIVEQLSSFFSKKKELSNKKVLVTAGPTYENIDPVRFIGNPSTGKMGVAIANDFAERGAEVILVLGPTSTIHKIHPNIEVIKVKSASDMLEACSKIYDQIDISIFAAAVADYTPTVTYDQKIKKKEGDLTITLKRTTDIAAALGKLKTPSQINIGFALETNNELENAQRKLTKKNFDMIVLNSLRDKGAGFNHNTNKVTFVKKDEENVSFPLMSKIKVAENIVNEVILLSITNIDKSK